MLIKNEVMKCLALYRPPLFFIASSQKHWFRTIKFRIYLILNLSDSEPIWFQTYLILKLSDFGQSNNKLIWFWTYLSLNLSDSDPIWLQSDSKSIWFQTYLIPNLSDSKPIWFQTYLIPKLSNSKPIWFWTYLIPNLHIWFWIYLTLKQSDSGTIWYRIYQILNLRPVGGVSPSPFNPEMSTSPSWHTVWRSYRQNSQSQYPPTAHNDRQPLLAHPVVEFGTKKVNPNPSFPLNLSTILPVSPAQDRGSKPC